MAPKKTKPNPTEPIDPETLRMIRREFSRPMCKRCSVPFEEGDKFCMCCGAPVKMLKTAFYPCMECGKPIPKVRYRMDTREHCPHCGKISKVQRTDRPIMILANIA